MTSIATVDAHDDTLPAARAVRLDHRIDYVPGAIVSRPIARSPGGSITLIAFDAGAELSEHTASYDAVIQVLEGAVEVTIGGVRVEAARGEAVRMPAGIPHAVRATERLKMLLTMVRR